MGLCSRLQPPWEQLALPPRSTEEVPFEVRP
jgi:hypothetical protein